MTTKTRSGTSGLRTSRLDRATAMRLAADEYAVCADAFAALEPADWTLRTPCPDWDVRELCAHVVGMAAMAAGLREQRRQTKVAGGAAERSGRPMVDELTALQVRERTGVSGPDLVDELRAVGPRAARGRRRTPWILRRLRIPQPQQANGVEEWWSIGFMMDVILTRDPWMHRMDLAEATGRAPYLTPEHDGVLVADVVAEWAARHGQPFALTLHGAAGGDFASAPAGERIELDAIDFCRTVSGRRTGAGLLSTEVPF